MNCPKCGEKIYLYKSLDEEGNAKVICLKIGCGYESESIEHHKRIDEIPTKEELNDRWS